MKHKESLEKCIEKLHLLNISTCIRLVLGGANDTQVFCLLSS